MKEKELLYVKVYETIREDILSGVYLPGEYLPSIRELAKRLGVARNTVETAYLMLMDEGFIQSRRGKGSQVLGSWQLQNQKDEEIGLPDGSMISEDPEAESMKDETTDWFGSAELFHSYPQPDVFPPGVWTRLGTGMQSVKNAYAEAEVETRVRGLIRRYLRKHRGVICTEDQIFLCRSIGQMVRMVEAFGEKYLYIIPHHAGENGNHIQQEEAENLMRRMQMENLCLLEDDMDGDMVFDHRAYPTLFEMMEESKVILTGTLDRYFLPFFPVRYVVFPKYMSDRYPHIFRVLRSNRAHSFLEMSLLNLVMSDRNWEHYIRKRYNQNLKKHKMVLDALVSRFGSRAQIDRTESGTEIIVTLTDPEDVRLLNLKAEDQKFWLSVRTHLQYPERGICLVIRYEGIDKERIGEGLLL